MMTPMHKASAMRAARGGRQVRSGASVINTRGIVWVYGHCWLASSVVDWAPVLTDWTLSYILRACLGLGVTISGRRSWTPLRG